MQINIIVNEHDTQENIRAAGEALIALSAKMPTVAPLHAVGTITAVNEPSTQPDPAPAQAPEVAEQPAAQAEAAPRRTRRSRASAEEAAAAPEPTPTPEPEPEPEVNTETVKASGKTYTHDDAQSIAMNKAQEVDPDKIRAIIAEYGVNQLGKVPVEKLGEFIAKVEALTADPSGF